LKKVLFISSRFPYPPIGGDVLFVYQQLKGLSKRYEVCLFALDEFGNVGAEEVKKLKKETGVQHVEFQNISKSLSVLKGISGYMLNNEPLQVGFYFRNSVFKTLEKLSDQFKPDVSIFQTIRTAKYSKAVHSGMKILFYADAISLNYKRALKYVKGKTKLIYSVERKRLLKFELKCLNLFDKVAFHTHVDPIYLEKEGNVSIDEKKLFIVPNGVDTEYFSYKELTKESKGRISFVGNMRTVANEDAVIFFARKIFPKIREKNSKAEFYIVGTDPTKSVLELGKSEGIHVTGRVNDVREYLWKSDVVVVPIRIAAGIQNKVLESMAAGRPVVSTSIAVMGIENLSGNEMLVSDESNQFAEYVINLLENYEKRKTLSLNARAFVEKEYSWKSAWKRMYEMIETPL
jgi:sugar transferase (PEP-CTERM/EpsH1 system associated)